MTANQKKYRYVLLLSSVLLTIASQSGFGEMMSSPSTIDNEQYANTSLNTYIARCGSNSQSTIDNEQYTNANFSTYAYPKKNNAASETDAKPKEITEEAVLKIAESQKVSDEFIAFIAFPNITDTDSHSGDTNLLDHLI